MTLIHTTQQFGIWCDLLFSLFSHFYKKLAIMTMKSSKNILIKSFTKKSKKLRKKKRNKKETETEINFSTHVLGYYFLCVNWPLEFNSEELYEDVNYIMIHERGFAHNHIPKATIFFFKVSRGKKEMRAICNYVDYRKCCFCICFALSMDEHSQ